MSRCNRSLKAQVAITALLAGGLVMGSTGVAIGASALSTDTNSSSVQYGTPGSNQVLNAPGPQQAPGSNQVLNAQAAPAQAAQAQAPRQLEVSQKSELPFTGYAPIPILLIGLLVLACGLVLRRGIASQSVRP